MSGPGLTRELALKARGELRAKLARLLSTRKEIPPGHGGEQLARLNVQIAEVERELASARGVIAMLDASQRVASDAKREQRIASKVPATDDLVRRSRAFLQALVRVHGADWPESTVQHANLLLRDLGDWIAARLQHGALLVLLFALAAGCSSSALQLHVDDRLVHGRVGVLLQLDVQDRRLDELERAAVKAWWPFGIEILQAGDDGSQVLRCGDVAGDEGSAEELLRADVLSATFDCDRMLAVDDATRLHAMAHALGHLARLEHVFDPDAIMSPLASSALDVTLADANDVYDHSPEAH